MFRSLVSKFSFSGSILVYYSGHFVQNLKIIYLFIHHLIGKKNLDKPAFFFAEHIKVNNVISCRNCFSGDNTHHSNEKIE